MVNVQQHPLNDFQQPSPLDRWLVISLARTGTREFVRDLLGAWPGQIPVAWLSDEGPEWKDQDVKRIPTWRSACMAPVNTIFLLPSFLLHLRKYIQHNPGITILFPSFHLWHGPAAWLARRYGARTWMIVHDGVPHPGENRIGLVWMENQVYRQADGLIFLSRYAHDQFCKQRFQPAHTRVLYHGPLTMSLENPMAHKEQMNAPFRILFFGRLAYYKGIDLLIDALRLLPVDSSWTCTIAGKRKGRFKMPACYELPVTFLDGRMEEKNMRLLFQQHDLLVLPYREASQSGVLMLAAAAGLSVVCTRVGGLQEQLGEDAVYWVDPDARSIGKGIFEMMTNATLREQKRAAIRQAGKAMNWGIFFKELEALKTTN